MINGPPISNEAYVKRKCKARRETEFFRKNSVPLHYFLT